VFQVQKLYLRSCGEETSLRFNTSSNILLVLHLRVGYFQQCESSPDGVHRERGIVQYNMVTTNPTRCCVSLLEGTTNTLGCSRGFVRLTGHEFRLPSLPLGGICIVQVPDLPTPLGLAACNRENSARPSSFNNHPEMCHDFGGSSRIKRAYVQMNGVLSSFIN
jgi:hypothetical protein